MLSPAVGAASAGLQPLDEPCSLSLDLQVDVPGSELEMHGVSTSGTVVLTPAVAVDGRARIDADRPQEPLLRAIVLAESDMGPTAGRGIGGCPDVTARGVFLSDVVEPTDADATSPWRSHAILVDT